MNIFENCKTNKEQGNLGEACAVFELTKRGYCVSKPLTENQKYDLIVDKDGLIQRVQVKTSQRLVKSGGYEVNLATSSHNRNRKSEVAREKGECDLYFVLLANNTCYLIPDDKIDAGSAFTIGVKYQEYKI